MVLDKIGQPHFLVIAHLFVFSLGEILAQVDLILRQLFMTRPV